MDRPSPSPDARKTRLAYRDRNRRRPEGVNRVRLLLMVLLMGQCLRVAFASPRLALREMTIVGSRRITPEQVYRDGGLHLGQNIFSINVTRVADRLTGIPLVRNATVTRELPGRLIVEIEERVASFTIQAVETRQLYYADPSGLVFEAASEPLPSRPTVLVASRDIPAPGGLLRPDITELVHECARLGQEEGLDVQRVRIDEAGELWLNVGTPSFQSTPTSSNRQRPLNVRLGRPSELAEKFRDVRLTFAVCSADLARAAYLNVMCKGRPAFLPVHLKAEEE